VLYLQVRVVAEIYLSLFNDVLSSQVYLTALRKMTYTMGCSSQKDLLSSRIHGMSGKDGNIALSLIRSVNLVALCGTGIRTKSHTALTHRDTYGVNHVRWVNLDSGVGEPTGFEDLITSVF